MPVCLCCVEASVRACGEKQPAPALHGCSPQPLPSPPLPHSPRRWWGGLGVKTVRVFSLMQRLVLLCQPTKCGSGRGSIHEGLRRCKRKEEAPACLSRKSGSCHFCVYHTLFCCIISFLKPNNSCRAAGRRDCFLSIMHQKIKGVVFIPEPDF